MKTDTLNILYEDKDIIVCVKPHGLATQSRRIGSPDLESLIKTHIAENSSSARPPYLAVIHRLDQPVAGILVFAKTPFAAKELNRQLQSDGFGKYYKAEVNGCPSAPEGTLENYMIKDGRTNTSRICDKSTSGAKLARLHYRTISSTPATTLLEIHLDTGRHHQIRVQLAHIGCPIIGDAKYTPAEKNSVKGYQELKLCAYKLTFRHPRTKKTMSFELP